MILNKKVIQQVTSRSLQVPALKHFDFPVRVLQFGTGVLLRGLTDHVIDKANKQGSFNGRITVVKSTASGNTSAFAEQDHLYTLQMKGIQNKGLVEETVINNSISKVLSAKEEWDVILREAENPDLRVVISNTTEVGLQLVEEDINQAPPSSFPAKLLAVLHRRYRFFKGSVETGLVVIPTELLPDNGKILRSIITDLIRFNQLGQEFEQWINESNYFCNSLVDRIVTGKPSLKEQQKFEQENGYQDDLLIVSEPYLLWAIEGDEKVKSILSFEQVNDGVIVIPDIEVHRELKLRLLNGTHTLSCALALLSGFDVVNAATNDQRFETLLKDLMAEIRSAMPKADPELATAFADSVLDRFRNPYIRHEWVVIAQQYTTKIGTRVLPLLKEYVRLHRQPPATITKGIAAYLFLNEQIAKTDNGFAIEVKGVEYDYKDEKAALLFDIYAGTAPEKLAQSVLSNTQLWGEDLTALPQLAETVQRYLNEMLNGNFKA